MSACVCLRVCAVRYGFVCVFVRVYMGWGRRFRFKLFFGRGGKTSLKFHSKLLSPHSDFRLDESIWNRRNNSGVLSFLENENRLEEVITTTRTWEREYSASGERLSSVRSAFLCSNEEAIDRRKEKWHK